MLVSSSLHGTLTSTTHVYVYNILLIYMNVYPVHSDYITRVRDAYSTTVLCLLFMCLLSADGSE